MNEKNDLFDFFQQASFEMQKDYKRITRRSRKDAGTAGDEGEENWANLLREWLPEGFHVVTKGQILFPDGSCSRQIDVLILKPDYPPGLIRKKIKKYLAHCVAAAFECKLTLRAEHIKKVFENARDIKKRHHYGVGSPFRELHSPIIFGLLAHSYDSKRKKGSVYEVVNEKICQCDLAIVKHPKEMPDLFCVANAGTWTTLITSYQGPSVIPCWEQIAHVYQNRDHVSSSYILHQRNSFEQVEDFTPMGSFICSLTQKLAWRRPSLRDLAQYYTFSKIGGTGEGISRRMWPPEEVYSESVLPHVVRGRLNNSAPWDEWSLVFI